VKPFSVFFDERGIPPAVARMWRARHGLPVVRIGRRLYVVESDFSQWVNKHKQIMQSGSFPPTQTEVFRCKSQVAEKMTKIY